MKTLIIAGGTGFLGNALIHYFKPKAEKIIVLTRTLKPNYDNVFFVEWDGKNKGDWTQVLEGADALINMSGKSVDCRYTPKNKELILRSRIDSTKVLGDVIEDCKNPPNIWLNSSTATIYRHSLDMQMDEERGEIGTGFSVGIAKAWEQQFFSHNIPKTRQVALRTAIVLGEKGGAFVPIKRLAQLGMGGKQGVGNQKVSFIHELDFARSIEFIINKPEIVGPINIISPTPTTNENLMETLRTKLKMPFGVPMSETLLKLGVRLIKTEPELILKSRNVIPSKLLESGFIFSFETLEKTLDDLLK